MEIGKCYKIIIGNKLYHFIPISIEEKIAYCDWFICDNKYYQFKNVYFTLGDEWCFEETPIKDIIDDIPNRNKDKIYFLRKLKINTLLNEHM